MSTATGWLLEASWEVCNKVGGIHTVIASKLPLVLEEYGDHYVSVGPYLDHPQPEFAESSAPLFLEPIIPQLSALGVQIHYGQWQVPGTPAVILLDWQGLTTQLNSYKTRFWDEFQLETLGTDFYDFDQPLLWGTAVGLLAKALSESKPDEKVLLQAHEWLSAASILIAKPSASLRTVFTTHATVLGRALASRNVPIYTELAKINPVQSARECGVVAKHQLERLGAQLASSFTTVSNLTAEESTAFLGRQPTIVTENGLALHELPLLLKNRPAVSQTRERIAAFIDDYFAPSYPFASDRAQWQCTMGRSELHNKGYDLYLGALAQLNSQLKSEAHATNVVALFFVATGNRGIRQEVLTARILRGFGRHAAVSELPAYHEVPISPFIADPNDPIPPLAYQLGLRNRQEDPVKLLYLPAYFDGLDGLLNEDIYSLLSACDLGVFPSFYEPWGYTPLESIALGVPAITSNLAGFGEAVVSQTSGVHVLDRRHQDDAHATSALTEILHQTLLQSPREQEAAQLAAYTLSHQFSWEQLYRNYQEAYAQAWN